MVPDDSQDLLYHGTLLTMSALSGYLITKNLIPVVGEYFLSKTKLHGRDMGRDTDVRLPESLGIVAGLVYLASYLLLFIITPLILIYFGLINDFNLTQELCSTSPTDETHGYSNSLSNLAAITSIFAMLILGFIDDCYDLRWRYKLIFPCAASVPLLSVYYYSYGHRTTILIPKLLTNYLGIETHLKLGFFYYIFMLMFVIFCTNAINIYAGINGIEVGQTIVWTVSILLYNLVEITTQSDCDDVHALSLKLLLPFLACITALYSYNRYPAQVFVGDSYCYFAGITIAVVGVIGHFSEEVLMFAIPQVFNFLVSVPQLFKLVPCPRHRLPRYNKDSGLREPSTFEFSYRELNSIGRIIIRTYSFLRIAKPIPIETKDSISHQKPQLENSNINNHNPKQPLEHDDDFDNKSIDHKKETLQSITKSANSHKDIRYSCNNFTLINLWLSWFGPKTERDLCIELLRLQSCLSFAAIAVLAYVKTSHVY